MLEEEPTSPSVKDPTSITMTCMTTKMKFDVVDPEVVVLRNGRYAFKAECPWAGKNGKKLAAFKFCSAQNYKDYESKKRALHKASTWRVQKTSRQKVQKNLKSDHRCVRANVSQIWHE